MVSGRRIPAAVAAGRSNVLGSPRESRRQPGGAMGLGPNSSQSRPPARRRPGGARGLGPKSSQSRPPARQQPGGARSASLTHSLTHSLSAGRAPGRARGARLDGLQGGCTYTCIDAEPDVVCTSMAERGAAQPASAEGDVSVYIRKGSCSLLTGVSSIPGTGPGGPRWRRILDAASEV